MWERGIVVKEWICQEEPLIRSDGASVGVGFRRMVELVRCKDCKYCKVIDWDDSNPYYGSCQYFNTHTVDADGFCYKAERNGSD